MPGNRQVEKLSATVPGNSRAPTLVRRHKSARARETHPSDSILYPLFCAPAETLLSCDYHHPAMSLETACSIPCIDFTRWSVMSILEFHFFTVINSLLLTIWTFVSLGLSGALYDISCRVHLCSKTYLLNKMQLWRSPYPPHWRHNFPTAWPSHSSGLAIIRKLLIVLFFSSYFVFVFCNIWSSSLEALFSYSLAKSRMGSC